MIVVPSSIIMAWQEHTLVTVSGRFLVLGIPVDGFLVIRSGISSIE